MKPAFKNHQLLFNYEKTICRINSDGCDIYWYRPDNNRY